MLKEIIDTIKDNDTIWVMENRENSDSFFKNYITDMLFSSTYVIVSKEMAYFFVHKLDEENIKLLDKRYSKAYIYESANELRQYIAQVLKELKYPKRILLSYTTMSDENTDILTHSAYMRVTKLFRRLYDDNNKHFRVSSSEINIYDIISKNTDVEIEHLKVLASITDEILKESFNSIKQGQTEIDIQNNTIKIMEKYLEKNMKKNNISSYSLAWNNCPIVLVGENLQKGGHAIPSNKKINYGDTIYYDFGIKATFIDGIILNTDMQRMGYMLKSGEKEAPEKVQHVFDTLISSITAGMAKMKPGVKGYEVDEVVRGIILNENYPDYPHATGHPVGKEVHGAGALISYRSGKRAKLKLVESGVYTLEPRVNIKNGGSIEEMIIVTKKGGIPVCNRQDKLYLI